MSDQTAAEELAQVLKQHREKQLAPPEPEPEPQWEDEQDPLQPPQ